MKNKKIITIGIDSSTTNCGIAVYTNGKFAGSKNIEFKGVFNLSKLEFITKEFNHIFKVYEPMLVIIEETVPIRNSRAVTALNQVFGAIVATAILHGAHVNQVHNKTMKSTFKYKTKEEAIVIAKKLTGAREDITEHEADAILVVETYKEMIK